MLGALAGLFLLSRFFSVSCPAGSACVSLRDLRRGAPLPEALHIYDRDGALLAEVAGPRRDALHLEEIPTVLADAFIAVEDRRFWDHRGIDGRGVMRAALRNFREGGLTEGASTIPMQLVRTLWAESLRGAHPWRRKVIEARIAPRLIEDLGHEKVLELYLNAIYLGNGVYGVERASRHYFGVGVQSLSLGQIATLVGITRAPEVYEPIGHAERARDVRDLVLRTLVDAGVATPEEAERAAGRGLELTRNRPSPSTLRRTHLTAAVTRELRRVAPDLAGTPGLRLHTTISARLQADGEDALADQIEAIEDGRYGDFETEDSTEVLEGAALALDPTTGSVLAWIGGRDFTRSEFDHVEQAQRQVGSLMKPFLVAAAVERGFGVVDLVSADTVPIATETGDWLPDDHVLETTLPLREALIRSSNRAAAHLGATLGVDVVVEVAERAGLARRVPAVPSSSLGAFESSLLEMTAAYAAFGNGGFRVYPHVIDRIESSDGELLWVDTVAAMPERIIDEKAAFVVLDAMQDVVDRGTGASVRSVGYGGPAAGKTGTTNEGRDAWFIGLTPTVAGGVWIGFDQPRAIVENRGGSALAAPVWGRWMRESIDDEDVFDVGWFPPVGVELVRYDPVTGEVVDPACRGPIGVDYPEAWVILGSYDPRGCRGGIGGWLDRLWRGFSPRRSEPLRPLIRSPR